MHRNIYTNIIFIGMEIKITIYTGKYIEILFILPEIYGIITQRSVIFLVSPWIIGVPFFSCIDNDYYFLLYYYIWH